MTENNNSSPLRFWMKTYLFANVIIFTQIKKTIWFRNSVSYGFSFYNILATKASSNQSAFGYCYLFWGVIRDVNINNLPLFWSLNMYLLWKLIHYHHIVVIPDVWDIRKFQNLVSFGILLKTDVCCLMPKKAALNHFIKVSLISGKYLSI